MTARLGYLEAGSGPTLVALHGGMAGARLTFGPVLPAWSRRLRVLAPDRRGFERSPTPAQGAVADEARDLLAFIDEHAGGRAHVLGASIGGVVALTALQLRAAAFRSITVIEAPAVTVAPDDPELAAWRGELEETERRLRSLLEAGGSAGDALDVILRRTDLAAARELGARFRAGDPGVTPKLSDLRAFDTPLTAAGLARCEVPALVCSGGRSAPRFRRAGELVAAVLGAEHLVIPGAGHAAHRSGPKFLAPLLTHVARAEAAAADRVPIALVAHRARWAADFARERAELSRALGPAARAIEHVGSTAVPGLAAKPVIDIVVGVADLVGARDVCERIEAIGYSWWRDNPDGDRRAFLLRCADGVRTHHVHVAEHGSPFWCERLAFRDELRASPDLQTRYLALKRALAARHGSDREAYTDAKGPFVAEVLGGGG